LGVEVRKSVLFVALLAAVLLIAPIAGAQSVEDEFGIEAIDNDAVSDRVGLVDPVTGLWTLRGQGGALNSFFYGNPGDFPMMGDWDCDGIETPGLYRQSDGFVYLRNSNSQGVADIRFFFGNPSDIPLAGDFNADGCDSVSIYRPTEGRIYIINKLGANEGGLGAADFSYLFGDVGDKPFVGDFNGDGVDTVGLHRESTGFVYFRQSLTTGIADSQFFFGDPGDRLVAGDWGVVDNVESPALFRPTLSRFFFRYTNTQGNADEELAMGEFRMLPVSGSFQLKLGLGGSLAKVVQGIPFAQQLTPVGGKAPYTVAKIGGPAFLSVNNAGVVFGTAPSLGTFNLTIRITDSTGKTTDQVVPLVVQDGCDSNPGQMPDNQCLALVDLYRKTGGNGWLNKANWFATPPCSWAGVVCHASGHVAELNLEENGLVGSIATVPWNVFGVMQALQLQHNALTGGVPATLLGIPNLLELDLSGNELTSALPALPGAAAAPLQILDLAENNIAGAIPAWVWSETSLVTLDLAGNLLNGALPASFGVRPALITLDLSENQLTGSIPNTSGLTNVVTLDLHENQLTGALPDTLGNPDKAAITELDVAGNQLAGEIPASITNLNTLTVPGGLTLCGQTSTGLLINGMAFGVIQTGNPLYDFVVARDPVWGTTC
jgi:hypothetical protein